MKGFRRLLSIVLCIALMLTLLAGCGDGQKVADTGDGDVGTEDVDKDNEKKDGEDEKEEVEDDDIPDYLHPEGFPIVKEPITLTAMASRSGIQPPWDDILVWQEYEEMTRIKIEWEDVTSELTEKRNLALATGEYPDLFFRANVSDIEILKYGPEGAFLSLEDLIDKHAPNYQKLLEENPFAEGAARMPDGNIYSFVQYTDSDPIQINPKLYMNKTWLDMVGANLPTTTDELYDVLREFKTGDPNGNNKVDEIPYTAQSMGHMLNTLHGAWGLRNRGRDHERVDMDEETGELRFIQIDLKYREMLEYINKLYAEGLIDEEIFTMNSAQLRAKGDQDLVGAFAHTNVQQIGEWGSEHFVGLEEALEGPYGDKIWITRGNVGARGAFIITDKCEYPEAAARWIDYFYSDDGSRFLHMGVEGVSYHQKPDGEYDFLPEIIDNIPDGSSFDEVISEYVPYAGGGMPALQKTAYFKGGETQPVSLEAAENMGPYTPKEVWGKFTFTLDELEELSALRDEIHSYADEMRTEFIRGEKSFEEWDAYIEQIEKMDLDRYMEIHNAAYERFKAN